MAARRKRRDGRVTRRSARTKSEDYAFCPFCSGPMDSQISGVRGALAEGQDVSGRGGTLVDIDICGIGVPAVVANAGSPLAREGFQVVFMLCSPVCAKAVCVASALDSVMAGREPNVSPVGTLFELRLKTNAEPNEARLAEMMDLLMKALPPDAAERLDAELRRDSIIH
jgi:hypothetical protein